MSVATAIISDTPKRPPKVRLTQVLETSNLRSVFSEVLGETVSQLNVERVLFSKSRPIVIHYRYQSVSHRLPRMLIGELVGADALHHKEAEIRRLGKVRRSQVAQDAREPLLHVDGMGLVLRRPGFDSNLLGLRMLHDRDFACGMISKVIGQPIIAGDLLVSLKAHRLGKRAVLLVECKTVSGTRRRLYVRLRPTTYEAGRSAFERHLRIAKALNGATTVRVPAPLLFDAEWGAAFFEEVGGTSPDFEGGTATETGGLAGSALAEWRALAPVANLQWSTSDELSGLADWSTRLGEYLPHKAPAFDAAMRTVTRKFGYVPAVHPAPCHRDFHEAQLLVDGNCCGMLDFDTWCDADPALDVGNFLAHIRLWELRNSSDASSFENAFIKASLDGKASSFLERVAIWKRAALLRLAAIYSFTSEADHIVNRLTDEAGA